MLTITPGAPSRRRREVATTETATLLGCMPLTSAIFCMDMVSLRHGRDSGQVHGQRQGHRYYICCCNDRGGCCCLRLTTVIMTQVSGFSNLDLPRILFKTGLGGLGSFRSLRGFYRIRNADLEWRGLGSFKGGLGSLNLKSDRSRGVHWTQVAELSIFLRYS